MGFTSLPDFWTDFVLNFVALTFAKVLQNFSPAPWTHAEHKLLTCEKNIFLQMLSWLSALTVMPMAQAVVCLSLICNVCIVAKQYFLWENVWRILCVARWLPCGTSHILCYTSFLKRGDHLYSNTCIANSKCYLFIMHEVWGQGNIS